MRAALLLLLLCGCAHEFDDTVLAVRFDTPYLQSRRLMLDKALADAKQADSRDRTKREFRARMRQSRTNSPPIPQLTVGQSESKPKP